MDIVMVLTPEEFQKLAEVIFRHSGIQLPPGKEYLLQSRMLPLFSEFNLESYAVLIDRLDQASHRPYLLGRVIDAITTNETLWFRDDSFFTPLAAHLLPRLIRTARSRPVRLWSAACSTGQEPYSLAILIQEELRQSKAPSSLPKAIEIVATDINERVLQQAAEGVYNQLAISRGMRQPMLDRYFTPEGIGYRLRPEIRAMVRFSHFNLQNPFTPLGTFDLILCRNVLIYFPIDRRRDICRRFQECLRPDGHLVVGAVESLREIGDSLKPEWLDGYPFYRPAPTTPETAKTGDQRRHTRLGLILQGELHLASGSPIRCQTTNVSFSGTALRGTFTNRPTAGESTLLRLSIAPNAPTEAVVTLRCQVVRSSRQELGLRFIAVDRLGYYHFKNLIVQNSQHPEKLLRELERHPGLLISTK